MKKAYNLAIRILDSIVYIYIYFLNFTRCIEIKIKKWPIFQPRLGEVANIGK